MKKYRWDKKYLYWGITAFCVIIGSIAFFWMLNRWPSLLKTLRLVLKALSPFIYGFIFAYLMNKVVMFFERLFTAKLGAKLYPTKPYKAKRLSRCVSIIITFIIVGIVVGGILALVLPQLYSSIEKLVNGIPTYYRDIVKIIETYLADNPELEVKVISILDSVSQYFTNWMENTVLPHTDELVTQLTSGIISVIREIASILIGIVVSFYALYHKEVFAAQSKKILYSLFKPAHANRVLYNVRFIDKTFGNFITGQLINSSIVGVICYIVLVIIKMPYAALVSVVVGVTNIIPFFGPIIGAVPSAFLILLESPVKCLIFIIFIVVLQQFDGNILTPKILGSSVGISGFWVMFAILLFGGIIGFWGMLLGVPILVVIYAWIKEGSEKRLLKKALPTGTEDYVDLVSVDAETNEPVYAKKPAEAPADEAAPQTEETEEAENNEKRDN